jgi:hypothetical protein
MSSENHHKTQTRDQIQAETEKQLTEMVQANRAWRQGRAEKFGYIDQYRIVRDGAEFLHRSKLTVTGKELMLAAALDRLAQMDDFVPAAGLEELLSDPDPEGEATDE